VTSTVASARCLQTWLESGRGTDDSAELAQNLDKKDPGIHRCDEDGENERDR
jgi:hypothetical protein